MRYFILSIRLFILFLVCPAAMADNDFTITSNSFTDGSIIPTLYSCDGNNTSPHISWSNLPKNTKSLALLMSSHLKDEVSYYWVIYNIPKTVTELAEGSLTYPAGSSVGINSFKKMNYQGPCPAKDSAVDYVFTLYALDNTLKLMQSSADAKNVLHAMQGHILLQTHITVTYSRWF